ncbi:MAG TPA: hypothetical protein VGW38_15820 [Chloroflexota bacterium]|nr:hypothetical protein [Chloroflexota bacterium]
MNDRNYDDLPPGWDEARVRRVVTHYEAQSDDAAAAEDEEAVGNQPHTTINVPSELLPAIRELLAKH